MEPEATRSASLAGRTLSDRYQVDRLLATGGMGEVYIGQHVHMQRDLAIKVLKPDMASLPELVARFEREAVAGAQVVHPNVASASDFGRLEDGSYFLVLEYVPGVTLDRLVARGPVSPIRVIRIARQIAAALDACHKKGVIHRDVKPRNVIVDEDDGDRCKLIDFGLARVPLRKSRRSPSSYPEIEIDVEIDIEIELEPPTMPQITAPGIVMGTIAYLAPEAEKGMSAIDERSDLYALGLVMYELLCGKRPFDAIESHEVFLCHRISPPPRLADRVPGLDVPPGLDALVMRLLAKKPAERPQSAVEVVDALDRALLVSAPELEKTPPGGSHALTARTATLDGAIAARVEDPAPSSFARRLRPRRWGLAAFAAVAVLVAAGALRPQPQSPALVAEAGVSAATAPLAVHAVDHAVADAKRAAESRALVERFGRARDAKSWRDAGAALVALAEVDPGAFVDPEVQSDAAQVAFRLEFSDHRGATPVFDALATRLGALGPDILYLVASTWGGSRGADRADALLARDDVRARTTPALRATLAVRDAACPDKRDLFERAAKDGDERTLVVLERLRAPRSCVGAGACCYAGVSALDRAIDSIRSKRRAD